MEAGLGPGDIVLDGCQAPLPLQKIRGHSSLPLFGPCLLWPNGRPSQQLLSSCTVYCTVYSVLIAWKSQATYTFRFVMFLFFSLFATGFFYIPVNKDYHTALSDAQYLKFNLSWRAEYMASKMGVNFLWQRATMHCIWQINLSLCLSIPGWLQSSDQCHQRSILVGIRTSTSCGIHSPVRSYARGCKIGESWYLVGPKDTATGHLQRQRCLTLSVRQTERASCIWTCRTTVMIWQTVRQTDSAADRFTN